MPWDVGIPRWARVDQDGVAQVARALASSAADVEALEQWLAVHPVTLFWQGAAQELAATVFALLRQGLPALAASLRDASAALADLGPGLDSAGSLLRAAQAAGAARAPTAEAADPVAQAAEAGVRRLLADADAMASAADRACGQRLFALAALARPVARLPQVLAALDAPLPTVPVISPERAALAHLQETGWSGLAPGLVAALAVLAPAAVAADVGAPLIARELAARLAMTAAEVRGPASLTAMLTSTAPDGGPRRFLEWSAGGALAEVVGDLATARTVVVLVPGTGTSVATWGHTAAAIDALWSAMTARAGGGSVAVVGWLGSPEPSDLPRAALHSYAEQAAPALRAFTAGLGLRPGTRLTLVGHSYGGVVTGLAVHEGLPASAMLGVAPAGFGPGVHSAAALHVPTAVLTDPNDPIRDVGLIGAEARLLLGPPLDDLIGALGVGHLGPDPVCLPGVPRLSTGDDGRRVWPIGIAGSVHTGYFRPGSFTLAQIAAFALGDPTVAWKGQRCAR